MRKYQQNISMNHLRISPFLLRVAIFFVEFPFHKLLRPQSNIPPEVAHLASPYLLIPNHKSVCDPFIIHNLRDNYLHYVVSDTHFRNPIVKFLLQKMGSIAKKKNQSDINTIKEIIYVLRELKEPICIFAEGVNTWDGESQALEKGTASLVKFAKVPVVVCTSHGAYYSRPRWGRGIRRGQVRLTYTLVFNKEELSSLSKEAIYKKLSEIFYSNEVLNQEQQPIAFPSPKRAEFLERVLFFCMNCNKYNTLHSHHNSLSCTHCSHAWHMDEYGTLHSLDKNTTSKNKARTNVYLWNSWQKNYLGSYISSLQDQDTIFVDSPCKLRYGLTRFSVNEGIGAMSLKKDKFIFYPRSTNKPQEFLLKDLRGINVQNNEKLEWAKGQLTYQLVPKSKRINTYKYLLASQHLYNDFSSRHTKDHSL